MVGPSLNSQNLTTLKPIKFLCSYGGRILPRYPDAKLRYHGGDTRVLSVDRSISFTELMAKLVEMCGTTVSLRCQLPMEDLDALISITSDEDLANLVEEYDRAAAAAAAPPSPPSSLKIRAFLSAPKKSASPTSSSASSSSNDSSSPKSPFYTSAVNGGVPPSRCPTPSSSRCVRHAASRPPMYPITGEKAAGKIPQKYANQYQFHQYHHHHGHGNGGHVFVVHNGSHCQ
ncbi:hypothetical protein ABFS83_05G021100 [Erythranthe nasuta]